MRFWRALALYAFVLVAASEPARAWNPFTAIAHKAKEIGSEIGGVLGSPFGGFADALAQPTLHDAEGSVHRLIGDVDTALGGEINRVGGIVSKTVDQVDHSLSARIVQVKAGVDDTVQRAFDRIDNTIGRIDDVARRRIAQIDDVMKTRLLQVDTELNQLLTKADQIVTQRLADVNAMVANAMQQADQIAQARIDQLDEIASKRLGNLDMIATKQTDSIKGAALFAATIITMIAFVGFVLWWAFRKIGTSASTQVTEFGAFKVPRYILQGLVVAGGLGVLGYLAVVLPHRTRDDLANQVRSETAAFAKARLALDMRDARYHEAQLQILDPDHATDNRTLLDKADVISTVFTRPTTLQTASALRDLSQQIAKLDSELPEDPDLQVVKAFITWQVGGSHQDELEAAQLCAKALQEHAERYKHAKPGDPKLEMVLASFARNYVEIVLAQPELAKAVAPKLQAAHDLPEDEVTRASPHQFLQAVTYDRALMKLRDMATPAYMAMLDAQAALQVELDKKSRDAAAVQKARDDRTHAAQQIVDAWKAFDEVLASDTMAGDTTALAAFSLDDAVLSHALYYVTDPKSDGLTPALATLDTKVKPAKSTDVAHTDAPLAPKMRIAIAPVRIEWARRFESLLGPHGEQVIEVQEAQRFKAFERRAHEFEVAYVGLVISDRNHAAAAVASQLGHIAAVDAAEMGLFRADKSGRAPVATEIMTVVEHAGGKLEDELRDQVDTLADRRAVRFL